MIYCQGQNEQKIVRSCREHFTKKALKNVFVITYERMRKYEGKWHTEKSSLFPNYIFLESEYPTCLKEELEQYENIFRILGEKSELISISQEEEGFLRSLCGEEHHFPMSRGYIQNGCTYVTEGPLRGKESFIYKIDRHKRLARLKVPFTDGVRDMSMGLEIVSKS